MADGVDLNENPYRRQADKDFAELKLHVESIGRQLGIVINNQMWIRRVTTTIGAALVFILPFWISYSVWIHNRLDNVVTDVDRILRIAHADHGGACHNRAGAR